jgi:endonuclease YncB( thermonuclease family)
MVENGWAVAYCRYSRRYVRLEKKARKRKDGIWRYKFVSPETWRRHNK